MMTGLGGREIEAEELWVGPSSTSSSNDSKTWSRDSWKTKYWSTIVVKPKILQDDEQILVELLQLRTLMGIEDVFQHQWVDSEVPTHGLDQADVV